jgi:hypothetical protein
VLPLAEASSSSQQYERFERHPITSFVDPNECSGEGVVGQIFVRARGTPGDVLARSYGEWLERVASKLATQEYRTDAVKCLGTLWFQGVDV